MGIIGKLTNSHVYVLVCFAKTAVFVFVGVRAGPGDRPSISLRQRPTYLLLPGKNATGSSGK